ncbi:MAG: hypothetical protein ABW328_12950 [Ilumatobacteraceae bacterium]
MKHNDPTTIASRRTTPRPVVPGWFLGRPTALYVARYGRRSRRAA